MPATRSRSAASSRPSRTSEGATYDATSRSSSARPGSASPVATSAAATATAAAPSAASGCLWVTIACALAISAARTGSPAYQAPTGATRIAAPFPHEPEPPNTEVTSGRHAAPARTAINVSRIAEP